MVSLIYDNGTHDVCIGIIGHAQSMVIGCVWPIISCSYINTHGGHLLPRHQNLLFNLEKLNSIAKLDSESGKQKGRSPASGG